MPLSRLEFSREFFQYFFTSSLIYCTVTQEGQLPFKLQFRLDLPEETRVHHSNATTNTVVGKRPLQFCWDNRAGTGQALHYRSSSCSSQMWFLNCWLGSDFQLPYQHYSIALWVGASSLYLCFLASVAHGTVWHFILFRFACVKSNGPQVMGFINSCVYVSQIRFAEVSHCTVVSTIPLHF